MNFFYFSELFCFLIFTSCIVFVTPIKQTRFFENERDSLFLSNCSEVLNSLALGIANFTLCSIQNARPVRICEGCVGSYLIVQERFDNLMNTSDNNGTSCKSILTSRDTLEVVTTTYNHVVQMWSDGNCERCYTWDKERPTLSNETKHFNELSNKIRKCIESHEIDLKNTSVVCKDCLLDYEKLTNYYESLSKDPTGVHTVCMDIVDSMNATREVWSGILDCCKLRKSPEILFLSCTVTISILPIIFYLLVKYCTTRQSISLLSYKRRFPERIFHRHTGSNE